MSDKNKMVKTKSVVLREDVNGLPGVRLEQVDVTHG